MRCRVCCVHTAGRVSLFIVPSVFSPRVIRPVRLRCEMSFRVMPPVPEVVVVPAVLFLVYPVMLFRSFNEFSASMYACYSAPDSQKPVWMVRCSWSRFRIQPHHQVGEVWGTFRAGCIRFPSRPATPFRLLHCSSPLLPVFLSHPMLSCRVRADLPPCVVHARSSMALACWCRTVIAPANVGVRAVLAVRVGLLPAGVGSRAHGTGR